MRRQNQRTETHFLGRLGFFGFIILKFSETMDKYIAFSGGVESRTMALLYGKGATAVFTDTGSEHEAMYAKLDEVEKRLTEIHDGDFRLIRIRANVDCLGEKVDSVEAYALRSAFLPGKRERK